MEVDTVQSLKMQTKKQNKGIVVVYSIKNLKRIRLLNWLLSERFSFVIQQLTLLQIFTKVKKCYKPISLHWFYIRIEWNFCFQKFMFSMFEMFAKYCKYVTLLHSVERIPVISINMIYYLFQGWPELISHHISTVGVFNHLRCLNFENP